MDGKRPPETGSATLGERSSIWGEVVCPNRGRTSLGLMGAPGSHVLIVGTVPTGRHARNKPSVRTVRAGHTWQNVGGPTAQMSGALRHVGQMKHV